MEGVQEDQRNLLFAALLSMLTHQNLISGISDIVLHFVDGTNITWEHYSQPSLSFLCGLALGSDLTVVDEPPVGSDLTVVDEPPKPSEIV